MNKKIIIISIVLIIIISIVNFSLDFPEEKIDEIFHITLANSDLYTNGVYTDTFDINKGEYYFRFVPNGSSPKILSVILNGENFDFTENFKLHNTAHQTGISEYFTWDYQGTEKFLVPENQKITITINPNGNTIGSVSVDIIED